MKNSKLEKETFLQVAEGAGHRSSDDGLPFQFLSNLPENLNDRSSLRICDVFITLLGILVFYVSFWSASFGVFFSGLNIDQMYFLSFIGGLMNVYFALTRVAYDEYLVKKTRLNAILRIIYNYTVEMGLIFQWAGLWFIMDHYIDMDVRVLAYSSGGSLVALLFMRSIVNLLTTPFRLFCSNRKFARRLKRSSDTNKASKVDSLFVLDTLFSVFVVGSLVVFAWRGVWCLFDIYLYPDDEVLSAFTSLVIGYAIVLIVFGLQTPMKKCCGTITGFWRLAALDLYILFSFMGTINVWRGIWNLLNIYLLPDSLPLSCWITHFTCFALLMLINCSNSILVRGVVIDGEEEGGKCVIFPISYLRTIFSGTEKKKEQGEQEEVSKNKNDVTV